MGIVSNILQNGYNVTIEVVYEGGGVSGIPTGGTTGQVLAKSSDANFDVEWITTSSVGDIDGGDANSSYNNFIDGGNA